MSENNYDVGYGKPPKQTQFKKGQSGNPKGRKKGARGLKTDLKSELNAQIRITENGKTVKLTKQQLMVKQLAAKAMKGDVRAISKITDLALSLLGPEDEASMNNQTLATEDEAILKHALARYMKDSEND